MSPDWNAVFRVVGTILRIARMEREVSMRFSLSKSTMPSQRSKAT